MSRGVTVADQRNYAVRDVATARRICNEWLKLAALGKVVRMGLPEIDDRYHIWRVPLVRTDQGRERVGELVIDAFTSVLLSEKSSDVATVESRLLKRDENASSAPSRGKKTSERSYQLSTLRNTIIRGDSTVELLNLPKESVDLVFTSPPYYNARPEYTDYVTYDEYLLKIRKVLQACHRLLNEGRFFIMNISPVLVRRASRGEASKRIAVPFDMHRLFIEEGYDFIDHVIWQKPEGAGWATGRGRRFAADRNPLQYKTVPVTEDILIYRKHTDKLIDWNIRNHPRKDLIKASKIADGYEKTNIWKITPAHDKRHPAIFPLELAQKVISYYSFVEDVVLDPFGGIGTTGKAAVKLGRRFVLVEQEQNYIDIMREEASSWLGREASEILTINCPSVTSGETRFF